MSTTNEIKSIRDRLAKEVAEGKKQYEQMTANLRHLAEQVKASEAVLVEKAKLLANLDNALRDIPAQAAPAKAAPKAQKAPKAKAAPKAPKAEAKPAKAPKAQKTPKAPKAPKAEAKPAKTAAKKTAGKGKGKGTQSLAAEGRRAVAEGLRPPIKDAIAKIMGGKTMSIDDIFEGLKSKSWLPNSSEPRQYIAYLLSTSKDRFERVASAGRGFYRVKSGDTKAEPVKAAPKAPKAEAKADSLPSTDEILANAGVLGNAVFGG